MVVAANMSWVDNTTTLVGLVQNTNAAANGFLGVGLLLVVWIVLFASFKVYDTLVAMIGSSFVVTLLAGLLWFFGLITFNVAILPVILLVVSVVIYFFK